MEKDKSLVNNAMFYGLIFGVILVLYTAVTQKTMLEGTNMQQGLIQSGITFVLYFAGVIISTIHFRKTKLDNYISYGKSFKFGVLVLFFSSFLVAVYTFVYTQWINPEYLQQVYEAGLQLVLDTYERLNVSDDIIEEALNKIEEQGISTPSEAAMSAVWGGIIMGIIVSLITSIFTQRKDPNPFSMMEQDDNNTSASN